MAIAAGCLSARASEGPHCVNPAPRPFAAGADVSANRTTFAAVGSVGMVHVDRSCQQPMQ